MKDPILSRDNIQKYYHFLQWQVNVKHQKISRTYILVIEVLFFTNALILVRMTNDYNVLIIGLPLGKFHII